MPVERGVLAPDRWTRVAGAAPRPSRRDGVVAVVLARVEVASRAQPAEMVLRRRGMKLGQQLGERLLAVRTRGLTERPPVDREKPPARGHGRGLHARDLAPVARPARPARDIECARLDLHPPVGVEDRARPGITAVADLTREERVQPGGTLVRPVVASVAPRGGGYAPLRGRRRASQDPGRQQRREHERHRPEGQREAGAYAGGGHGAIRAPDAGRVRGG